MIYSIILMILIWSTTSNRLLLIQLSTSPPVNVVTTMVSGSGGYNTYCPNSVDECTEAIAYASDLDETAQCINGICAIGCDIKGATTCEQMETNMQQPQKCDDTWKVCVPKDFTHPSTTTQSNVPVSTTVKINCATTVTLSCTTHTECEHLVNCFDPTTIDYLSNSGEMAKCIQGECTITCNGAGTNDNFLCSTAQSEIEKLFPGQIDKLICVTHGTGNGRVCKRPPPTTTTSTISVTSIDVTPTTFSTTKPDMSCKTATECDNKAIQLGWSAFKPTDYQENYICRHNMCTITCNKNDLCSQMQDLINNEFSGNHIFKCATDSTGAQQICAKQTTSTDIPINPTVSTSTSTKSTADLSCEIADDCKAKAADFGFGNTNPTDFGEDYACVNKMCTVTCGTGDICPTVQSLINNQLNTNYILECKNDANGSKVCLHKTGTTSTSKPSASSTSTAPNTITSTVHDSIDIQISMTDDASDTCDTDPCSPTRIECDEEGKDGYCSVQFDFNIDVCILHHGFRRNKIYQHIRDASEFIVGAICDNGEFAVLKYDCEKKENPQYLFDAIPTTNDQCPAGIDEKCEDGTANGFAANIQGSVAVFCECENEKNFVSMQENLKNSLTAKQDFVGQMKTLSVTDDTLCAKGFGKVEANTFTISIKGKDGQSVEVFDITAAAPQRYYYVSSVVLFMLFFVVNY